MLAVKDENHLKHLIGKLSQKGIKLSIFNEPDIDNQVTAITIEPGILSRKMCSNIPLALKEFNSGRIHKHFSGNKTGEQEVVVCN